jgi:DNA-binding NarL/FixJ family response regulator
MSISTQSRPASIATTNILIVDDHDLVAMSLALCLRSEGLHAQRHAARSRDGILTAVATLVPGVVLLDLDLGRGPDGAVIDGTTLVSHLCRRPPTNPASAGLWTPVRWPACRRPQPCPS